MKNYKAIIVDDELHGRENLRLLLKNYVPEVAVVGEAQSTGEASLLIEDMKPDIVFLDILMPVNNGFDLLEQIPAREFAVIFVSASLDFGIQAVKAGVLDYLLKPINVVELQEAVKKAADYLDGPSHAVNDEVRSIVLSQSNGFSVVNFDAILLLQADNNYTRVYTTSGKKFHISKPLKDFERILPDNQFVRTHRSYIINLSHLIDYNISDCAVAVLKNGLKIPVAKRREPALNSAIRKIKLFQ